MRRYLTAVGFFLAGGAILAVHLSHWLLPTAAPLTPVGRPDPWVTTPRPGARGYFRHDLHVPSVPEHAWPCLPANDYPPHANGTPAGANRSLPQTGTPRPAIP